MKLLRYSKRFVFLAAAVPVFFLTFMLYRPNTSYVAKTADANYSESAVVSPPALSPDSFPIISAQGVYAYDLDSGKVLYEKDSEALLLPASTTKIVTALTAMDYYDLNDVINTGQFYIGGSRMGLNWNESITAIDLLYGLLVSSANDAAEVLARSVPGGRAEFIRAMNEKANALHAYNTHFSNPSGLDEDGQITTAKDLARLATYAMQNTQLAKIVATENYTARDLSGTNVHYLTNRNELLGVVPGVLGVKTGWTQSARENLVAYVERDGKRVMIAVLGSQDRFGETVELIDWIFENYSLSGRP